ncbi:unnamed protein product [Caenorhabditis sp. 36 PRJEB53466]|nr:unnamed protein product [Caenorhabditis sp. 36 PRJEB53466]
MYQQPYPGQGYPQQQQQPSPPLGAPAGMYGQPQAPPPRQPSDRESYQTVLPPSVTPGWNDPPPTLPSGTTPNRLNAMRRRPVDPSISGTGEVGPSVGYGASPASGHQYGGGYGSQPQTQQQYQQQYPAYGQQPQQQNYQAYGQQPQQQNYQAYGQQQQQQQQQYPGAPGAYGGAPQQHY